MVIGAAVWFFTMTTTCLVSVVILVSIHDTQAIRQAGSIILLKGLHHHAHVTTQKHGLHLGMYDF